MVVDGTRFRKGRLPLYATSIANPAPVIAVARSPALVAMIKRPLSASPCQVPALTTIRGRSRSWLTTASTVPIEPVIAPQIASV
jgi:hypothetical protein